MSVAARAWEKHAGREGGTFEPLKGNVAQKNESASKFVSYVLSNPGTVKTELSRGSLGLIRLRRRTMLKTMTG